MAYRDDAGEALEAPTSEGTLVARLTPHSLELRVGSRTLHIAEKLATLIEHHKKHAAKDKRISLRIDGVVIVARDVPRDDVGIWIEVEPDAPDRCGMRRIFGVEPVSLLESGGLTALAALDRLAARLRTDLAPRAGEIRRAIEVGRGLDKVLVADHGHRYVVYARRLFRDRARFAMAIHEDGKILVPDKKGLREITVTSRFGVTVWGDNIRFADPHGSDLAKVSIPWIDPEDRKELARRIGQLVDREADATSAWPPHPAADSDRAR